MEEVSLSDIAAVAGKDGCNSNWILILLFAMIYGWGGNGFGNNNNTSTETAVQRAVDLNSIQEGQAGISADIQRTTYETMATVKDSSYNNLSELRDLQSTVSTGNANIINNLTAMAANQQNCCCTTQRAIDGVNYNIATQSAAIQANSTANAQKILDAISASEMSRMKETINKLELQNQLSNVVRYPTSFAYASSANPFCSCSGCGS